MNKENYQTYSILSLLGFLSLTFIALKDSLQDRFWLIIPVFFFFIVHNKIFGFWMFGNRKEFVE